VETMEELIRELTERKAKLRAGGGPAAVEKQHKSGKLTARERLDAFFDPGTFLEYDLFAKHIGTDYGLDKAELPADGVVTGVGKVDGRNVFAYSEDFTVVAGTFGERHGKKISKTIDLAQRMGCPVVGMNDSGGARVTEEMGALSEYGQLFFRHVRTSGVVPQIALIQARAPQVRRAQCTAAQVQSAQIGAFEFRAHSARFAAREFLVRHQNLVQPPAVHLDTLRLPQSSKHGSPLIFPER